MRPTLPATLALLAALAFSAPALAADRCPETSTMRDYPPVVSLRIDNDLFANRDEGYTSGVMLSMVSPNLNDYVGDPCLPAPARWINSYLAWLQPEGFDQQNMVVNIAQGIFTPTDPARSDLIEDDRPYAGALLFSFGYNARTGDRLRTTQLTVGMVGPASLAESTQGLIHDLTGSHEFNGWEHQLHNEPVLNLVHEQSMRTPVLPIAGPLELDAIGHWGGAVGNLLTQANAGFELRIGQRLPDDFGSSPVRPAGNNTAPPVDGRFAPGWAWHAFLAADARRVLRDITLDGNTFRNSHRVDKKPWVGEVALGFAITHGRTKFAFARYFRTREFDGQDRIPAYGSFTISRAF
ncbi:MAG: lipid A deacylase LpxR family protein [Lysobacter sp.]